MTNFIKDVFIPKYYSKLKTNPNVNRADGFLAIFLNLIKKRNKYFHIVETGTCRNNGFEHDGNSTILFNEFVNYYDGRVISIDICQETINKTQNLVGPKVQLVCGDSVKCLWNSNFDCVDLFYLDSFDIDINNLGAANLHHLKELCCISRYFQPGTLIGIDDCNFSPTHDLVKNNKLDINKIGKGQYIKDFMNNISATCLYKGYQEIWKI